MTILVSFLIAARSDLVGDTNKYLTAAGKSAKVPLLNTVSAYVAKLLRIFGVEVRRMEIPCCRLPVCFSCSAHTVAQASCSSSSTHAHAHWCSWSRQINVSGAAAGGQDQSAGILDVLAAFRDKVWL